MSNITEAIRPVMVTTFCWTAFQSAMNYKFIWIFTVKNEKIS